MVKAISLTFITLMVNDGRNVGLVHQLHVDEMTVSLPSSHLPMVMLMNEMSADHEKPFKIALTGIVLVKEKYAIGNADDIAKIPERVFKGDARAMFVPSAGGTPWFCRPVDYMLHPEYEIETINTIAIIELAPTQDDDFPMKPVCWPPYSYNTSQNLFVVGYTDENELLEKFLFKLQYVEKDTCKQFYNRAGLSEGVKAPAHYECGFAPNNKESCVWDNGMALISNSSGLWMLIGLGVHGPGCSAPARFILLTHYFEWIESTTSQLLMNEEPTFPSRRSAFNEGFKRSKSVPVEYVPAHLLLRSGAGAEGGVVVSGEQHVKHDVAHHHQYDVLIHQEDPFLITRISGTEIHVTRKQRPYMLGAYGNCSDEDIRVMYKDYIKVNAVDEYSPPKVGTVQYKLHARKTNRAYLYYDTIMEDGTLFPKNLEEIIRVYPLHKQTTLLEKGEKAHLTPAHITSKGENTTANSVNLYLKVVFQGNCNMEIKYYGRPDTDETTTPILIITTPTTATTRTTTIDPYANLRKYIPLEFLEDEVDNKGSLLDEDVVYNNAYVTKIGACFWSVVIFSEIISIMLTTD